MPIKTKKKHKGQNRPSEIRFTGVPPIMPIKTPNNKKNKKNRQSRPSQIRLLGVPPIMPIKTPKHRYRARLPPSTIYKNSKNIERTLF